VVWDASMTTSSCVLLPALPSDDTLARSSARVKEAPKLIRETVFLGSGPTTATLIRGGRWFKSTQATITHQVRPGHRLSWN